MVVNNGGDVDRLVAIGRFSVSTIDTYTSRRHIPKRRACMHVGMVA